MDFFFCRQGLTKTKRESLPSPDSREKGKAERGNGEGCGFFFFAVSVDQNQNGIFAVSRFAEQGVNRRFRRAQAREFRAVEKARMVGAELLELREVGNG